MGQNECLCKSSRPKVSLKRCYRAFCKLLKNTSAPEKETLAQVFCKISKNIAPPDDSIYSSEERINI